MAPAKISAVTETLTEPPQRPDRTSTSEPENREEIALRAYHLWQERGCPIGSPEEDWFRAEEELRRRKSTFKVVKDRRRRLPTARSSSKGHKGTG